jgi:hypothetical protein
VNSTLFSLSSTLLDFKEREHINGQKRTILRTIQS